MLLINHLLTYLGLALFPSTEIFKVSKIMLKQVTALPSEHIFSDYDVPNIKYPQEGSHYLNNVYFDKHD